MAEKKLEKKIVDKAKHVKNAIKTRKEVEEKIYSKDGYIDKADDFPLTGEEKRAQDKMGRPPRTPKTVEKPKKKLTPEILDAIARVQGRKRKIYTKSDEEKDFETLEKPYGSEEYVTKKDEELQNLYGEIKQVNESIKELKGGKGGEKKEIENRLNGIIDRLAEIEEAVRSSKVEETPSENPRANVETKEVQDAYHALDQLGEREHMPSGIVDKLMQLKHEVDKDIGEEAAVEVPVKRVDEQHRCSICGQTPCRCFLHLTKPVIKISPNGSITISFEKDWNGIERKGFMKSMGYFPLKKVMK